MSLILNALTSSDRQRIQHVLSQIGAKRKYAALYDEIMCTPKGWATHYFPALRERLTQQKTDTDNPASVFNKEGSQTAPAFPAD